MEFLSGIRPGVKRLALALLVIGAVYGAWSFGLIKIPGLTSEKSKVVGGGKITQEVANEKGASTPMLEVPDINNLQLANTEGRTELRLMNWVWFANAPVICANGGLNTMAGSLMDKAGINLRLITNNSVDDMKRELLAFVGEYAKGNKNPQNGVYFITNMGDGDPALLPTINKVITKAYGPEYKMKIIAIQGFSMGEDCVFGPPSWKENPQLAKGAVISAVIGDGDWGLGVRFFSGDNGLTINPDPETYDAEAVNFIPAPDYNFLMAAQDAFTGRVVTLKVKDKNGKLTGKTIKHAVDAAATWFPGDKQIAEQTGMVRVISTKEYSNQMANVIIGCDKWMKENSKLVVDFLSATLTAANQIKQHEPWFRYATELAPKAFCVSESDCSETSADWYKYAKPGGAKMTNAEGIETFVGGTQMANLADNKKYFGLKGGNSIYKSVWDYFSQVITDLNPANFNQNVGEVIPYEEAVDLSYLKRVNVDAGVVTKPDYESNTGVAFADKSWKIEFESGSARITEAGALELNNLFNSLNIIDESAVVSIVGHTDDVGPDDANMTLSLQRANAVKNWLINRSNNSFPSNRFKTEGKGELEPLVLSQTPIARSKNRRVQIILLQ